MGPVQQHLPARDIEQLQAPRPANRRVSGPPRLVPDSGDPRRLERVERRVGDRRVRRLVASPQADPDPSQPPELDVDPVTVQAEQRRRRRHGQRSRHSPTSALDHVERPTCSSGHRQIAAHDDRRLLARDRLHGAAEPVRVVERDVRDHRHAAVPGVSGVEPSTEADLDHRQIHPGLGKPAERDRRQQLELRRLPVARGDAIGQRQHLPGEPGERLRVHRHAVDLEPLAIRDQMRLGRLAGPMPGGLQRRADQRQDAALAVRAGDQGAAEGALRVAETGQQSPRAGQPEVDSEAAARLQRHERVRVAEPRSGRPQSLVSSSS